jgi:hypothetical protein
LNFSTVVRIGDAVHRSAGPWSPAIRALLRHLEQARFEGAPRALGFDDHGREVLSYLDGQVFPYPMPEYVWSERCLVATARLLRSYHDGAAAFIPPTGSQWRTMPGAPSEGSIICHNDIAPYNSVFLNEEPVAFIDCDLAAPGPVHGAEALEARQRAYSLT